MRWAIGTVAIGLLAMPANAQVTSLSVKDWLAVCDKSMDACDTIVMENEAASGVSPKCTPADDLVETKAVVAWLIARPETHDEEAWRGIEAALVALYSCNPK
jgi:hypothetical protein